MEREGRREGREGKGREGKGREGKGREGKGTERWREWNGEGGWGSSLIVVLSRCPVQRRVADTTLDRVQERFVPPQKVVYNISRAVWALCSIHPRLEVRRAARHKKQTRQFLVQEEKGHAESCASRLGKWLESGYSLQPADRTPPVGLFELFPAVASSLILEDSRGGRRVA